MTTYDSILLGSSPNALTAAAYLARAGQRALVLEPTAHIGGATATIPFADAPEHDLAAMIQALLDLKPPPSAHQRWGTLMIHVV